MNNEELISKIEALGDVELNTDAGSLAVIRDDDGWYLRWTKPEDAVFGIAVNSPETQEFLRAALQRMGVVQLQQNVPMDEADTYSRCGKCGECAYCKTIRSHLKDIRDHARTVRELSDAKRAVISAIHGLHESQCGSNDCVRVMGALMRALPVEEQPDLGD